MARLRFIVIAVFVFSLIGIGWLYLTRVGEPSYEGKSIGYWFEVYTSPNDSFEESSQEATFAFKKMGTNALPFLIKMAFNSRQDTAFRTNVYEWLGKLPAFCHAPSFIPLDRIRAEGRDAIISSSFPSGAVLPFISRELDDTNSANHVEAVCFLSNLEDADELRVRYLVRAFHATNLICQEHAVQALQRLGNKAKSGVPEMISLFQNTQDSDDLHLEAMWALREIGSNALPAIPALTAFFNRSTNWIYRYDTATTICLIDPSETEALHFLMSSLTDQTPVEDPSDKVIIESSSALAGIQRQYIWASSDDAYELPIEKGRAAAFALGYIGKNAKLALPALEQLLNTTNLAAWEDVVESLAKLGEPIDKLLPHLREKLNSTDQRWRIEAAAHILAIDSTDEKARLVLIAQIEEYSGTNHFILIEMPNMFDRIGIPPESFLPKLDETLMSDSFWGSDEMTRLYLASAMVNVYPSDHAVFSFIARQIDEENPNASFAINGIPDGKPLSEELRHLLQKALKSKNKQTRRSARLALRNDPESNSK